MRWDAATYRWTGTGGDIWPTTWAADGALVTAWGDGEVGCRQKASYGVAAIASDVPGTGLAIRHCGPGPQGKGKMMAPLPPTTCSMPAWPRKAPARLSDLRSSDGGREPGRPRIAPFPIDAFVQFGKGKCQTAATSTPWSGEAARRSTSCGWRRAAPRPAQADEYFSGSATLTCVTRNRSSCGLLHRPCRREMTQLPTSPPLGRSSWPPPTRARRAVERRWASSRPLSLGPLEHRDYVEDFLGMRDGSFLGMHFPIKWQTDGGRTLGRYSPTTTGRSGRPRCSTMTRRPNMIRATLTLGWRALGPAVTGIGGRIAIRN